MTKTALMILLALIAPINLSAIVWFVTSIRSYGLGDPSHVWGIVIFVALYVILFTWTSKALPR